jgi:AcrR family transcriptional regulator
MEQQGRKRHRHSPARAEYLGPERRRPLVLDVALPLFIEHGFEGATIEMIASGAGVTRPVIYECYRNKRALFDALVTREHRRIVDAMLAALPKTVEIEDPHSTLVLGFDAFLATAAEVSDSWRLLFLAERGAEPEIANAVAESRAAFMGRVAAAAGPLLQARGILDQDGCVARLLGEVLVGIGEAGARSMLGGPDAWAPERLGLVLGKLAAGSLDALAREDSGTAPPVHR